MMAKLFFYIESRSVYLNHVVLLSTPGLVFAGARSLDV